MMLFIVCVISGASFTLHDKFIKPAIKPGQLFRGTQGPDIPKMLQHQGFKLILFL